MHMIREHLQVIEVNESIQDKAKELILEGLTERFGFLDRSFNMDLNDIQENYLNNGDIFLVGMMNEEVICTGALKDEAKEVGRIVRMSVAKSYRRNGLARIIITELEHRARSKGFNRIVLETNNDWYDAIDFYRSNGYTEYALDESLIHMEKVIRK